MFGGSWVVVWLVYCDINCERVAGQTDKRVEMEFVKVIAYTAADQRHCLRGVNLDHLMSLERECRYMCEYVKCIIYKKKYR
jgi:hypothetical protein